MIDLVFRVVPWNTVKHDVTQHYCEENTESTSQSLNPREVACQRFLEDAEPDVSITEVATGCLYKLVETFLGICCICNGRNVYLNSSKSEPFVIETVPYLICLHILNNNFLQVPVRNQGCNIFKMKANINDNISKTFIE